MGGNSDFVTLIKVDGTENVNFNAEFNRNLDAGGALIVYGHKLESIINYFGRPRHDQARWNVCAAPRTDHRVVCLFGTYVKKSRKTEIVKPMEIGDVLKKAAAGLGAEAIPEVIGLGLDAVQKILSWCGSSSRLGRRRFFVLLDSSATRTVPRLEGEKEKAFLFAGPPGRSVSFKNICDMLYWIFSHETPYEIDYDSLRLNYVSEEVRADRGGRTFPGDLGEMQRTWRAAGGRRPASKAAAAYFPSL